MAKLALGPKGEPRGVLRVLVVVQREERRAELRAALTGLADPPLEVLEAEPGFVNGANGTPPADVEMIVFDGEEEGPLNHLRSRAGYSPRPALFALLPERSPSLMRRVLRAGADEVLFLPLDPGEATGALLKISEARRRSERGSRGAICSLISTVGGVGVTTLTANLALALRHCRDKRVAVVDLDLQEGGLGLFLNLEPERTIADLTDPAKKLDSIQLELALSKHPSGIYMLAAPKQIEDSEKITDAVVGPVLELMRQLFDYVVVDCGRHISEAAVGTWERSEHLFYVVDQSLVSLRCALRFLDLFGRLRVPIEPEFILNRFVVQCPISDEQVSHTLARPIYARLPCDEKNLERVQWGAHDLWQVAPRSALVQSFENLATKLSSGGAEVSADARRGGIMSRLLASLARN